jgi:hypothetical protein
MEKNKDKNHRLIIFIMDYVDCDHDDYPLIVETGTLGILIDGATNTIKFPGGHILKGVPGSTFIPTRKDVEELMYELVDI